jgi:hypothetical protein
MDISFTMLEEHCQVSWIYTDTQASPVAGGLCLHAVRLSNGVPVGGTVAVGRRSLVLGHGHAAWR